MIFNQQQDQINPGNILNTFKVNFVRSLLVVMLAVIPQKNIATEIKTLWTIEDTFKLPESAVYDPVGDHVYISNIVKYKKDGSGFISKINGDGKNLQLKWIIGLNSPTGLSVYKQRLYAVDMDVLVIIDLKREKIIKRIAAPDFEKKPLLNDVAISKQGDVYVSGSASRRIYKLEQDKLVVFAEDKERLLKANGLLVDDEQLIHGGQYWSRYSRKSGGEINNNSYPTPSSKLYDFDGITSDGNGGYIVTVIDDPRLWHISNKGRTTPLSQQKIEGIDIHFDQISRRLFVPRVGGGLSVFQVDIN